MLKAIAKISAVVIGMGMITGCASHGARHMQEMHDRLAGIEARLDTVDKTANEALRQAQYAHEHAASAEALAKECKQTCEAHSAQMERMFHKSMMK